MKKRHAFGIAIALLILYSAWHRMRSDEGASTALTTALEEGRLAIVRRVRERTMAAFDTLFDELDADNDGKISKKEFDEARVRLATAMSSVDIPELPDFSSFSIFGMISRIISLHLFALASLFILENLRAMIFGYKHAFHLKDYVAKVPDEVGLDVALKYDTPLKRSAYEKAKRFFFLGTGLAFTRLFIMVLGFVIGVSACNMASLGGRNRNKNPWWFGFWRQVLAAGGWLLIHALGFHRTEIVGELTKSADAKILIGNHVCVIEALSMFCHIADMPSFVSRVENLGIPLFRGVVNSCNAITVDRDAAASRAKTLQSIQDRLKDPKSEQLMIFPEGTTANQLTLFQYRRGAFEPGLPVQMVCFKYPYRHFNPCWTGRITGGSDMFDMLLRMCCQFTNYQEVAILPLYYPTEEEKGDSTLYAKHVQRMMANVLGVPTSNATYADYVALDQNLRKEKAEKKSKK